MSNAEKWLPVAGFEGLYEVSDQGRVKSLDRWATRSDGKRQHILTKLLKAFPNGASNHQRVDLRKEGKTYPRQVHRLVMESFVGPYPDGQEIRHLDGDPTNNALSNLAYGTRSDNLYDAVRHKTHWQSKKTHCPLGHELIPPNLVPSHIGHGRSCLACQRARNYVYKHKALQPHLQDISDKYHAAILKEGSQ